MFEIWSTSRKLMKLLIIYFWSFGAIAQTGPFSTPNHIWHSEEFGFSIIEPDWGRPCYPQYVAGFKGRLYLLNPETNCEQYLSASFKKRSESETLSILPYYNTGGLGLNELALNQRDCNGKYISDPKFSLLFMGRKHGYCLSKQKDFEEYSFSHSRYDKKWGVPFDGEVVMVRFVIKAGDQRSLAKFREFLATKIWTTR